MRGNHLTALAGAIRKPAPYVGDTTVADVIVPERFTPYVELETMEKSAIVQSGALVDNAMLSQLMQGGGLTFQVPNFNDLEADDADDADLPADDTAGEATPRGVDAVQETAVRLSRSQGWKASDLAAALAGADPMGVIGGRVATYWARRLQKAVVASLNGVFADNDAAPSGTEHVQGDLTNDISTLNGGVYQAGLTDFSAAAFIDATQTMGDAAEELALVIMHSIVYSRAKKNNLIDFIPDSQGVVNIPTFLGKRVVVDDGMPNSGGVFDTWIFGSGALQLGRGTPKTPTEVDRNPRANNGSGEEELWNRVEWTIHPVGHAYVQGAIPNGGPSNANLATAGNWQRVFPERKQIKVARLKTRES